MNKYLLTTLAASLLCPTALAAGIDGDAPYLIQTRTAKPVEYQRRAPLLEELIHRSDFPYQVLQPIPLRGVRIQGLQPKTIDQLGFNYFIVVDNPKHLRMSDIYKESRMSGKSNFVTCDAILHPYLAFSNRVIADAITTQMVPDMVLLLDAMQKVSLGDYKEAEDAEVRQDIERNIAYIAVGIKLLNPRYELPNVGDVRKLAEADLRNIFAGRPARSSIFERNEDYSQFKPQGMFTANDSLQAYFRCREWLSRVPYPIVDVSAGTDGHMSNNFRRSVLLFRSLDQAQVLGKPAIELWGKLVKASSLLGTPIDNLKERTLYPEDYRLVFQGRSSDLKVTLNALAEPLFRTKLMLAIRRHKPVSLTSASIFELDDASGEGAAAANFRLFPIIAQPEQPWMRAVARSYPTDKQSSTAWPVGLLDMYAWGSPMAGNLLCENIYNIDPTIAKVLPDLVNCVTRRLPGGQAQTVDSRAWRLLSTYFKPLPEGVPGVLRSESWLSRRLLSAVGGWVDSQCAIASEPSPDQSGTANGAAPDKDGDGLPDNTASGEVVTGVPTSPTDYAAPRRISKAVPFHYLEPAADLYRLLEVDANKLQTDLTATGYFPDRYKQRFGDFLRLFQRLQKISETELRGQKLANIDRRLLANIDQILDKVDVPLPAVLAVEAPSRVGKEVKAEDHFGRGMNLAIGRPGMLYIIYQNPHTMEWTLGRGAVYTYYEMPAPLLTASMWQHKLEAGFAQPLPWTARYQIVQKEEPAKKATAAR